MHNNTSCNLILETDNRDPVRLSNKNRVVKDQTSTSQNNIWLQLHYLVQDTRRSKAAEPAFGWGDSVFTYELVPGSSVLFMVPLIHFKKGLAVVVPFKYAWEGNTSIAMGVGGVVHRVYFLREDLPTSILDK